MNSGTNANVEKDYSASNSMNYDYGMHNSYQHSVPPIIAPASYHSQTHPYQQQASSPSAYLRSLGFNTQSSPTNIVVSSPQHSSISSHMHHSSSTVPFVIHQQQYTTLSMLPHLSATGSSNVNSSNSQTSTYWRPSPLGPAMSNLFAFSPGTLPLAHSPAPQSSFKTFKQHLTSSTIQAPSKQTSSSQHTERNASVPHHHAKLAAAASRATFASTTGGSSFMNLPALQDNTRDENTIDSENWTTLDIGGMGIQNISKSLFHFDFLTTLYLNHNSISYIASEIGLLVNLTCLHLSGNRIKNLPQEIGKLSKLKELFLFDNLLTTLPFEFGYLYQLTDLYLDGNPWTEPFYSILQREPAISIVSWLRDAAPEPPRPSERTWITLDSNDTDSLDSNDTFTVFDYNILCSTYVDASSFGYVPSWALSWDYRKELIMQEILQTGADVICLQEVELQQYDELFLPTLQQHGYEGVFLQKTRAKTMSDWERKVVDGCATFYRTEKFHLEEVYKVEFGQLAMNSIVKSDLLYNRVMNRDNVALLCRMTLKTGGHQILIGNVHIHWDPMFKDVKLLQILLLLEQLANIRQTHPGLNMVITGDFNSLPDSGVYEILSKGILPPQHIDFCKYVYEPFYSEGSQHSLPLKDAYASNDASLTYSAARTFTNYTPRFEGVIDYIWYSSPIPGQSQYGGLVLSGIHGLIPRDYLKRLMGALPNAHFPSDHISLMAGFRVNNGHRGGNSPGITQWKSSTPVTNHNTTISSKNENKQTLK